MRPREFFCWLLCLMLAPPASNSCSAAKEDDARLTVAIAIANQPSRGSEPRVIKCYNKQSHFHVVVTNCSDQPIRLWESANSWGHHLLRFEVVNESGELLYRIEKVNRQWTERDPDWLELAAGEPLVIEVYFDHNDREGWQLPFLGGTTQGDFPLRIRAVFENKISEASDADKANGLWTGKTSSPLNDYVVRYMRDTPETAPPDKPSWTRWIMLAVGVGLVFGSIIRTVRARQTATTTSSSNLD